jgi:hypothetical protein
MICTNVIGMHYYDMPYSPSTPQTTGGSLDIYAQLVNEVISLDLNSI